ncbi:MAG: hypothetical protein HLUCCA11_01790 [Phormidesmis priestleyi Ana]|uniref:Uncharacterized protein n=1 Tax=Phormidesmis priestleyi Ana TaxID=1666911 RepID=A0A0P7ZUA7_9CYAN|nr:MAG: hypothetical protein HLUCCA11_01790 [Phormidesmis priestleyi Ana]
MSNSHLTSHLTSHFSGRLTNPLTDHLAQSSSATGLANFCRKGCAVAAFAFSLAIATYSPKATAQVTSAQVTGAQITGSVTSVTPPAERIVLPNVSPEDIDRFTQQTPLDLPVPATTTLEPSPADIIVLPNVSPQDIDRFTQQSALELPTPTAGQLPVPTRPERRIRADLSSRTSFISDDDLTSIACYYSPGFVRTDWLSNGADSSPASSTASFADSSIENRDIITVAEFSEGSQESTVFRYQQFANIVTDDRTYPTVIAERTYILYDRSLAQARRELVNDREQYARFLGLPLNSPLISRGFSVIDRQLSCERIANNAVVFTPGDTTEAYRKFVFYTELTDPAFIGGAVLRQIEPFNSILLNPDSRLDIR